MRKSAVGVEIMNRQYIQNINVTVNQKIKNDRT